MGSEMNHGAESQRWHDHAPIRQMTGGTGLGKKVERTAREYGAEVKG